MNILEKITTQKLEEVARAKKRVTLRELESCKHYHQEVPSLRGGILKKGSTGIIAEFKRESPSKGKINANAKIEDIIPGYENAGVAGISILTDTHFFGGSDNDLTQGRDLVKLPILRKEFIIDPYQVHETKAIGASAILLIGAILDKPRALDLASLANELGLEVLFEIHAEDELELLNKHVHMVGINNRDLKTFKVDLEQSIRLASRLPDGMVPIAESGINSTGDYLKLKNAGFNGFLVGEYFMKHPDPAAACMKFCIEVRESLTL